mgnify:CR=1 FL=1
MMLIGGSVMFLILVVLIIFILTSCIRIVPQAQALVVERLGGTTDGKTYTLHGAETAVSGVERNGVLYTPFSYLWDSHIPQTRWDKSRNRVIITRRWLFWRHKTVRGLRVGDSEARFLDLYGSPDARDETMVDLLHVTIENGIVTEIFMGRYE